MDAGAGTASLPEPSRVRVERRGGFAGLHLHAEHPVPALSAEQRQALMQLLKHPPAAKRGSPPGADRFVYRLQLTFPDGGQQQLDIAEDDMPEALAELVKP